jgi:5'-nucleotidase
MHIDERKDGRGNPYYWLAFNRQKRVAANGSDLWAIENRRIAVTPLRLDMTDEPFLTRLGAIFDESHLTD